MSFKTFVLQEINSNNIQPVTKRDIESLKSDLIWPPTYMRNPDLVKADKLREDKALVINNPNISTQDKVKLLSEVDQNYKLFQSKVDHIPSNNIENINENSVSPPSPYLGRNKPLGSEEILDELEISETNEEKARSILNQLLSKPGVVWNSKGELYNPNSKKPIVGSNIGKLIEFDLQSNTSRSNPPRGYSLFQQLKSPSLEKYIGEQSEKELSSGSETEDFVTPSKSTPLKKTNIKSKKFVRSPIYTRKSAVVSTKLKGKGYNSPVELIELKNIVSRILS